MKICRLIQCQNSSICVHCTCDGGCELGHEDRLCGNLREGNGKYCLKTDCAHDETCTHSRRAVCYRCRRARNGKASRKRCDQLFNLVRQDIQLQSQSQSSRTNVPSKFIETTSNERIDIIHQSNSSSKNPSHEHPISKFSSSVQSTTTIPTFQESKSSQISNELRPSSMINPITTSNGRKNWNESHRSRQPASNALNFQPNLVRSSSLNDIQPSIYHSYSSQNESFDQSMKRDLYPKSNLSKSMSFNKKFKYEMKNIEDKKQITKKRLFRSHSTSLDDIRPEFCTIYSHYRTRSQSISPSSASYSLINLPTLEDSSSQ